MREAMNHYCRWAFFHGYICTANDDGSIPLNSFVVLDCRGAAEEDAQRVVSLHNEQRNKLKKRNE